MRRSLFNFLAVLSLLLCIAVGALWSSRPQKLTPEKAAELERALDDDHLYAEQSAAHERYAQLTAPSLIEFEWRGRRRAVERRPDGFAFTNRSEWQRRRAIAAADLDRALAAERARSQRAEALSTAMWNATDWTIKDRLRRELADVQRQSAMLGIRIGTASNVLASWQTAAKAAANGDIRVISYGQTLAAFGTLPVLWLIDAALRFLLRRRRRGQGLCAACGYDLRATTERCPECGAAVRRPGTTVAETCTAVARAE